MEQRFRKRSYFLALLAGLVFLVPPAYAASLTPAQISSIVSILTSFGAATTTVANVQAELSGGTITSNTVTMHVQPSVPAATLSAHGDFTNPQPVTIQGYNGSAEEPRLSPDGQYLVFDDRDPEKPTTSVLYYAKRIDDLTWAYAGPVQGTRNMPLPQGPQGGGGFGGGFYYWNSRPGSGPPVCTTAYRGTWNAGTVSDATPLAALGNCDPNVNMGIDRVAADGTVYLAGGDYSHGAVPKVTVQMSHGGAAPQAMPAEFAALYADPSLLVGAPVVSPDGLEAFVTIDNPADNSAHIFRAIRASTADAFAAPQMIAAAAGFVEGETLSPDGNRLYYHKSMPVNGKAGFGLFMLTRQK